MSEQVELAGRGRRLVATLIDVILVPALTILFVMVLDVLEDPEDYTNNLWMIWVLLLAILSYMILNGYTLWHSGQTLGKKCLGIAIVASASALEGAGEVAPFWKLVCIRALFFPLLFLAIIPPLTLIPLIDLGFIFGKGRRCLHDIASGTSVIRLNTTPTNNS